MATSITRSLYRKYANFIQLMSTNSIEPYLDRDEVIRVILDGVGTDEIAVGVELYFSENYFVDGEETQIWKSDACSHNFWESVQKCVQTRTGLRWQESFFKKRSIIGLTNSVAELRVDDAVHFKRAIKQLRNDIISKERISSLSFSSFLNNFVSYSFFVIIH